MKKRNKSPSKTELYAFIAARGAMKQPEMHADVVEHISKLQETVSSILTRLKQEEMIESLQHTSPKTTAQYDRFIIDSF